MKLIEQISSWLTDDEPVDDGIDQEFRDYRGNKTDQAYSILVVRPVRFTDAERLADKFKYGHTLVVDVSDLAERDSQRLTDFLNGVVMARNGMIRKISPAIFICSPESVKIVIEK